MAQICTYRDLDENICNKPVGISHDEKLCVYHAPKYLKGMSDESFEKLISEQIDRNDYNFEGYIFPGKITFANKVFDADVNFNNAKFEGKFRKNYFEICADFEKAEFKEKVKFIYTQFSEQVEFQDTQFLEAGFIGAQFSEEADFRNAHFKGEVSFVETQFSGKANFSGSKFYENACFAGVKFLGPSHFVLNEIQSELEFSAIEFDKSSSFYFTHPYSLKLVIFREIQFNPFKTYFENIPLEGDIKITNVLERPTIIFRYCNLKDVYFTNNKDMSIFSFYKSAFDEARFISSEWGEKRDTILKISYQRKNIIFEENFYEDERNKVNNKEERQKIQKLKKELILEDLNTYKEIASMYRRMKTALDRTKDYQEAGGFYFNEFEMKRQASTDERLQLTKQSLIKINDKSIPADTLTKLWGLENQEYLNKHQLVNALIGAIGKDETSQYKSLILEHARNTKIIQRLFDKARSFLYYLYKILMGYGEKPFWSFVWAIFFYISFVLTYLFYGLKVDNEQTINYDLALGEVKNVFTWEFISNLFCDLCKPIAYTFYRIIPVSYLPKSASIMVPDGSLPTVLSLANTLILILMLTFIGIGLKRHFRRF